MLSSSSRVPGTGQNKPVLAGSCFRFRPPSQEGHKVTGPSDVKLQVLTGGPGRGRAPGRRGAARTKGLAHRPRRAGPPDHIWNSLLRPPERGGEEGGASVGGGQGGASPRPPLRLVPSPGTQPRPPRER